MVGIEPVLVVGAGGIPEGCEGLCIVGVEIVGTVRGAGAAVGSGVGDATGASVGVAIGAKVGTGAGVGEATGAEVGYSVQIVEYVEQP